MAKKSNTTGQNNTPKKEYYQSRGTKVQHQMLVIALAQGLPLRQAAEEAGVSVTTAWRYSQTEECQDLVARLREQAIGIGLSALTYSFEKAVKKMGDLIDNADTHAVQLRAAQLVVDSLVKVRDHVLLANRLAAIEKELGLKQSAAIKLEEGGTGGTDGTTGDD